jgi:hypothetical protein
MEKNEMKYILLLTAFIGGCAIAPVGFSDRERGYNRGDGSRRDRDYNDANYLNYSYCGECGNQRGIVICAVTHSVPSTTKAA